MDFDCCPICGNELMIDIFSRECKNGCYEQYAFYVIIFDKIIKLDREKEIEQKISYWKENDRYLIKLMGGE